jgi:hypothetical protein
MTIGTRDQTYLVTRNEQLAPAAAGPLDFGWVVEQMHSDPAIKVETTLRPRNLALQSFGSSVVQEVVVASMPPEKADELAAHPQMVVEPDHLVFPTPAPVPAPPAPEDPGLLSPFGTQTTWEIQLASSAGGPVAGATVYLYGRGVPAQGRTDDQGRVTISLLNETDDSLQAIYVNPQSGHWTLWVNRPALTSGILNTVQLRALSDSFPAFPGRQLLGWGQQAMGLDRVPASMDGHGVKVAVVDSGAAVHTHPDLGAISRGGDFAGGDSGGPGWTDDVIAHGSHCSGVIAGSDDARGIRGFAPAAEVHEARIFPGGRMSSLLDALDYCMDQGVDVVNMSLGAGGSSQIFLQKLAQARQQGVACIVAAGNSGDQVQFPGISPDVFTVAAIGRDGTFPDDSYHAQVRWKPGGTDQGFFAAQFSCHGPEIDACAPGVAIVSSVPADGYASWDGTSMATPHVTGLAALVLAHHPDFQTPALRLPTAARVDRLFEILTQSCRPLSLQDPSRTGAGLPDAVRALGVDAAVRAPSSAATDAGTQTTAIRTALDRLRLEMVAAGLVEDEPAVVTQSAGPPQPPSERDIRRALAELRAQMEAAGVFADAEPVPAGG